MDLAGTFFSNFMTILIALQVKSVSFHFTKNLDLDELDFFELTSVVCRHRQYWTGDMKNTMGPMNLSVLSKNMKEFWNSIYFHIIDKNNNDISKILLNFVKKYIHWLSEFRKYATSEAHRLHVFSLVKAAVQSTQSLCSSFKNNVTKHDDGGKQH